MSFAIPTARSAISDTWLCGSVVMPVGSHEPADLAWASVREAAAGSVEAAPLLRGEPAQPVRHADLRGASCFDPQQLRADVGEFFRGLRRELGGKATAVCVDVGVASGRARAARALHGRPLRAPVADPRGVGARDRAHQADRRSAGRLGRAGGGARWRRAIWPKYVSKNVADERVPRLHRYEVAQGFQPERVPLHGRSEAGGAGARPASGWAAPPSRVWRSSDREGWRGPPAYWCAWAG